MIDDIDLEYIAPATCFDMASPSGKGRKRKVLNATGVRVIEALARVMCTEEEIAACLGVKIDTLHAPHNVNVFLGALEKGRECGKMSLRRHQFELSKTNATMAIWLGKQYLGQKDDIKLDTNENAALDKICNALTGIIKDEK